MMLGNWSISVGNPWWLILIPLVLPPLFWTSYQQPRRPGIAPPRAGDPVADGGDHPDRSGPRRIAVGAAHRPPGDHLPARRLQQCPARAAKGRARLRDRGIQETAPGRPGRSGGLRHASRGSRSPLPPATSICWASKPRSTPKTPTWPRPSSWRWRRFPTTPPGASSSLSDGNENRGNLFEQALTAKSLGVQVDVLPIEYFYDREVLVEKVSIPPDVKKGETVNINVVIRASEPTRGTLQVFQKADNYRAPAVGNEQPVPIELQRGINVFTLKQLITEPNFYTFSARVHPREGQRRPPGDQQHRRGVHARTRQGPGPLDRGNAGRARRAGQGTTREGDRGQGAGRSQDRRLRGRRRRSAADRPGPAPAVRLRHPGQRPQGGVHREPAPAPGLQLPRHGGRARDAGRQRQLWRRRLDEHARRKGAPRSTCRSRRSRFRASAPWR